MKPNPAKAALRLLYIWRHARVLPVIIYVLCAGIYSNANAQALPFSTGINLPEAALNPGSSRIGFNYAYPAKEDVSYFVRKGFKIFRLAILQERLVNLEQADVLLPDWEKFSDLLAHAKSLGARVVIDLHQFGFVSGALVGRDQKATDDFVKFWAILAARLKDEDHIIFGLMNEPHQQTATEWLRAANRAIRAIRDAGARQLILVPGSYWDAAESWVRTDNGRVMLGVEDPRKNFAYEVHQYLDADTSGTSATVVKGAGGKRLKEFTEWLRANKAKGFLGEFGFAATPEAMAEGRALLSHIHANKDVWLGWTYWAAGRWWGDYMFSVQPTADGKDRPQLDVLLEFQQ